MSSPLPPPTANQAYVTVSPLAGGYITLTDHFFVPPSMPNAARTVPSLAFLITHPGPSLLPSSRDKGPFHLMFDLGLRKSATAYPPTLQSHLCTRRPHQLAPGVAAQLRSGGLPPEDVDMVILSHVHYDHHGDPEDFPRAQFRVGRGGLRVLEHGLGPGGSHQHFVPGTLPAERTEEFSDPEMGGGEWKAIGPFPAALDLFHDGSVYVVDVPGHLPGHVNLLCRMEGERWMMLCGDAYHDRRLLTGEKDIGTWEGNDGSTLCIHHDVEEARRSIARLAEWDRMTGSRCELIAAHDEVWWAANRGKEFPGRL